MSIEQAAERYEQYRSEGRLLRGAWTDEQDGKQRAYWLAALSPEVERAQRPEACPSALLPQWFALLVPWMDDNGTESGWADRSLRFGQLLRRMPTLGAPGSEAWERLRIAVLLAILDESVSHVPEDEQWGARAAIAQVREALQGRGDLAAARAAAWAAGAADRMIEAIFVAIETECARAGAQS